MLGADRVLLDTAPLFEGDGIRLWDHREGRAVASAEWFSETTGFGFPVRARANAFFDDEIAQIAHQLVAREAYFESRAQRHGLAI